MRNTLRREMQKKSLKLRKGRFSRLCFEKVLFVLAAWHIFWIFFEKMKDIKIRVLIGQMLALKSKFKKK